ncbi:hypothetical protein [Halomonas marinisediminis]|uniref:hypothetical protein n=1 Tax=Halomonas marinisediminis TaxID=2546095 RepID=UPI00197A7C20|nr:hypothetical protein [Halomonas marinisediminis]
MIDRGKVDICLRDPGFEIDLYIAVDLATLTGVWLGDISLDQAIRRQALELQGPHPLRRQFQDWLQLSMFDQVARETRDTA